MGTLRNHVKSTIGNSGSKNAAAKSVELFNEIVERLSAHFDKLSNGDDFVLLALMTEYHSQISAGNIQVANSTPAPAGALPAGKPTPSNTEAERIGTEVLTMVGGDVTQANGGLKMLDKIVKAGHHTAVFAGYLLDGVEESKLADVANKVDLAYFGDYIITTIKNVADGNDNLIGRGLGAQLESTKTQSQINRDLNTEKRTLFSKLGVNDMAAAETAIDNLRNNTSAVTAANQAWATSLDSIGTALGLNLGSTDNKTFEGKIITEVTRLKKDAQSLKDQITLFHGYASRNPINVSNGELPSSIITKLVAWQENNASGVLGSKRPEIRLV